MHTQNVALLYVALFFTCACADIGDHGVLDDSADLNAASNSSLTLKVDVSTTYLKASTGQSVGLKETERCTLERGATITASGIVSGVKTGHVQLGTIVSIKDAAGKALSCPGGLKYVWRPHFEQISGTYVTLPGTAPGPGANNSTIVERIRQAGLSIAPGSKIGLATAWLPKSARSSVFANADASFNSLSSAKWLWAAAALSKHSAASIEEFAKKSFELSVNDAAGELIRKAGGLSAVNDFLHSRVSGASAWKLCNWKYVSGLGSLCSRNVFTPRSALAFLTAVYDEKLGLSDDKVAVLDRWARLSPNTGYGGWIGNELPAASVKTMRHKAGWYNGNINEVGLIRPENGGTYAFAASIEGPSVSQSTAAIARMSCLVYYLYNNPGHDPFSRCQ